MLAALFAVSIAVAPQGLDQRIDYTTRAKRLDSILEDLSKTTKLHLECTADIRDEPLIFHLSKVPLKEAMDKVAGVFGGEWTKTDKGFKFGYGRQADAWHEESIQRAAATLMKSIDEKILELSSQEPLSESLATKMVADAEKAYQSPLLVQRQMHGTLNVAVLKILRKLNPRDLCFTHDEEKVVFATSPTPFERELPECGEEIEALVTSCHLLSDVHRASRIERIRQYGEQSFRKIDLPVLKVILKVNAFRGIGTSEAFLTVFGSNDTALSTRVSIGNQGLEFRKRRGEEQRLRNQIKSGVRLGRNAEEIVPFILAQGSLPSTLKPISNDTRELVLNPTKHDPLAFATSDIVLGLAEQASLNIVYLPTDNGEAWAYIASRGGSVDLELFEKVLARSNEMELTIDDKWFIGRPDDPLEACRTRLPRPEFEKFVNTIAEEGFVRLEPLSELALTIGVQANPIFCNYAASYLCRSRLNMLNYTQAWFPYAFYGSVAKEQQEQIAAGSLRLIPAQLSQEQVQMIERWLMNRYRLFRQDGARESKSIARSEPSLGSEPTEALARGLGMKGFVEFTQESDVRFRVPNGPEHEESDMEISLLVFEVARYRAGKMSDEAGLDLTRVTPITHRTVKIKVCLDSGYGDSTEISEDRPMSDKPMTLDQALEILTPQQKREYEKAYREAVDSLSTEGDSSAAAKPPR
jgi:hypothetical protein